MIIREPPLELDDRPREIRSRHLPRLPELTG